MTLASQVDSKRNRCDCTPTINRQFKRATLSTWVHTIQLEWLNKLDFARVTGSINGFYLNIAAHVGILAADMELIFLR